MRYSIVAVDPSGAEVTLNYGRGEWALKARDKALYTAVSRAAMIKIGLLNPRPWNERVMVTKTNLMSGEAYEEEEDTPISCSPASETYWSM